MSGLRPRELKDKKENDSWLNAIWDVLVLKAGWSELVRMFGLLYPELTPVSPQATFAGAHRTIGGSPLP